MGLWWKEIEGVPTVDDLCIQGSPAAYSKTWPLLWRWNNPWYLLRLHLPQQEVKGCYIRFNDGFHVMQYRKWIDTEYVAVRVGFTDCCFSALDIGRHHSLPVFIENVGIYQSFWGKNKGYEKIQREYPRSLITFI